jgi:hypothetical protein
MISSVMAPPMPPFAPVSRIDPLDVNNLYPMYSYRITEGIRLERAPLEVKDEGTSKSRYIKTPRSLRFDIATARKL